MEAAAVKYRYPLPAELAGQAASLREFANGAAQCRVELSDGSVHADLLVSNATAIIAMRGHTSLPFEVAAIARLFQADKDESPVHRGDWQYFDEWRA
jgi:hypothetical protein